jgi:hypothetical protein
MLVDNSGMKEIYVDFEKNTILDKYLFLKVGFKTFFRLIPIFYELKRLHYPYISTYAELEELKKYFTDFPSLRSIHSLQKHLFLSSYHSIIHGIVISLDYNLPNITDCYI